MHRRPLKHLSANKPVVQLNKGNRIDYRKEAYEIENKEDINDERR